MLQANQLIGFGIGSSVSSVSLLDSGGGGDTISGLRKGDVVVLFIGSDLDPGDGHQEIFSSAGEVWCGYKIIDTETTYDTVNTARCAAVFRGDIPVSYVLVKDIESQSTTGNPTSQTVSAASGKAPLVVFGCYNSGGLTTIDPRTMSPAKDGEQNPGVTSQYLAWKIYNSSPQDVSVDMDDEGSFTNSLASFYIEFY